MNKLDFSKDIILQTDRLILRKISMNDLHDIFEYAQNEEVAKWASWSAHKSIEDTKKFINSVLDDYEKNTRLSFAIVLKSENKVIGSVGFNEFFIEHDKAEMGYALSAKYWGKGYATEMGKKFIEFGFNELGLNRIEAYVSVPNEASRKVLRKILMQFEGLSRQIRKNPDGSYRDLELYAIIKDDLKEI